MQQETRPALRRVKKDDPFYLVLDGLLHISEKQDPYRGGERLGLLCGPDKRGVRPFTVELANYDVCGTCQVRFEMVESRGGNGR